MDKIEKIKAELSKLNMEAMTEECKPVLPMNKRDEAIWRAGFSQAVLRMAAIVFKD